MPSSFRGSSEARRLDNTIRGWAPIVSYTLNKKMSFAIGDAQITIDWNKKKFVALPLSFQTNYIAMLGKQPIRLFVNPQYNVINSLGSGNGRSAVDLLYS